MTTKAQHVKYSTLEVTCLFCGKKFMIEPYRKNRVKYCSHQCGNTAKARNNRINSSESQRGKGEGKTYCKWFGRHMHRVVAEQKIGRPLIKGEVVHHIDGNKLNNRPDNLQVTTKAEHARRHSLELGSQGRMYHKIKREDALAVFNATGSQSSIGKRFNIAQSNVSKIKRKKTWKHLHINCEITSTRQLTLSGII